MVTNKTPIKSSFWNRSRNVARLILLIGLVSTTAHAAPTVVTNEFIYEKASFPSCHASTLAENQEHLVASWFGGLDEGDPSVGIWVSIHDGQHWSAPVEVANGDQASGDVKRYPCWNPVLHTLSDGRLLLFYKVGPNPRQWWGMVMESIDGGKTWSRGERLPEGILGPIKNKPIQLPGGRLLSGSSTEDQGWRAHFEWSDDQGKTWHASEPLKSSGGFGIIQPTIIRLRTGELVALCRSRQGKIIETRSTDNGQSWSDPKATELPNNNSGLDAVTLSDGRHALIYNHTPRGRTPLNLAIADDSLSWKPTLVLESDPGEYSYPAIIQTKDGKLHMTYTWKRERIKHVVVELQ